MKLEGKVAVVTGAARGLGAEIATAMAREAERCTVASDYGWAPMLPRPATGYKTFLERLWDCGVAESKISTMAKANPARLLGLQ